MAGRTIGPSARQNHQGRQKGKGKEPAKPKAQQQVAYPNSKTSLKKAERAAKGKGKEKNKKPHW